MTKTIESRGAVWVRVFSLRQVNDFGEMKARMLGTLANISQEADDAAEARYEELMGAWSDGSDDPADAADEANETGIALYQSLADMRQAMLNFTAAGIYHLFEQQAAAFARHMGGHAPSVSDFKAWMAQRGIDVTTAPPWNLIANELRLVANVVKHAEGRSAQDLRLLRPDLFQATELRALLAPSLHTPSGVPVSTPMAGESVYVDEATLDAYIDGVRDLWEWLRALV
jgi:hypothetical protein